MEFQFDQEKYPRKNVSELVADINLDYSCEPLTSYGVYENNLKASWPKEGTYDYFKLEGSGYEGELGSAYLNFYKLIPETDEQYARRVYRRIEEEAYRNKEYEWYQQREEERVKRFIKANLDTVKKWIEE